MKYLHEPAPGVYHLDHRLAPEVSAMFAAMSSRMPKGGIQARYGEIVEAVAEGMIADTMKWGGREGEEFPVNDTARKRAEDRLCEYPIHPRVQGFFDRFVLNYGHSSIMELTGQPAVYTEGISWYTAYLLFDSPLCAGQEFSTRAVRHKDWPMARECFLTAHDPDYKGMPHGTYTQQNSDWKAEVSEEGLRVSDAHPVLKELHDGWFEVFEAEVTWWAAEFRRPCSDCEGRRSLAPSAKHGVAEREQDGVTVLSSLAADGTVRDDLVAPCPSCQGTGKMYPHFDKEPFRPALDRARWAIPGTISTGCCHTGHLRERARILRDGLLLAQRSKDPAAIQVWENIREGYTKALPGLAGMGLREAVYGEDSAIPAHLFVMDAEPGPEVEVKLHQTGEFLHPLVKGRQPGQKSYLDPVFNQLGRVDITFRCSLAVSRDWHRHRTMYPWSLDIVRGRHADIARSADEGVDNGLFFDDGITIHPAYEPKSDIAKAKLPGLLKASTEAFDAFMQAGNQVKAMLALPLGTQVQMKGQSGLRDAIYMLELRRDAHGANFEYQAQATEAMRQLTEQLGEARYRGGSPIGIDIRQPMGLLEPSPA
jgi:hypothetical protein